MDSRFDDLLHTVVVEKGQGIHGFFDVVFGFMYRRTDFFYEMAPGENMGFLPGQNEAIVYNYFKKYQSLHYKERVPKRNIDPKEIEDYIRKQRESKTTGQVNTPTLPVTGNSNTNVVEKTKETIKEEKLDKTTKTTTEPSNKVQVQEKPKCSNDNSTVISSNSTSNNPLLKVEPISISTYNGDQCDLYNWSQGVNDVTIQLILPKKSTKDMFKVTLTNTSVKIKYKDEQEDYFSAEFCEKIKSDDSNWTLEEGKNIIFFLEKNQELIWKSAFKGHKEIDTKKVDNSKRIEEFDTETQAALNKIVYEQNRKRNGLPTTEEEKKLQALKEAWNAPDSPYKGQPFDPSMFNLNEPIYMNTPDYEAKLRAQEEKEKK